MEQGPTSIGDFYLEGGIISKTLEGLSVELPGPGALYTTYNPDAGPVGA